MTPRRRTAASAAPTEETAVTVLDTTPELLTDDGPDDAGRPGRAPRRLPTVRPQSPTPTYLGIAVAAVGFVLIAFAWGQVAGEVNVALQLPYIVSGAFTGLGLVMVGMTIISVAARRRDAALREQQTQLLADALRELGAALGDDEPRR